MKRKVKWTPYVIKQTNPDGTVMWSLQGLLKSEGKFLKDYGCTWIRGVGCPGAWAITPDVAQKLIDGGIELHYIGAATS